jgi:hypothetical protein
MNNLLHYRNQKNFESILSLLTDALPNNAEVQAKLDTLITKKSSYIKKLLRRWIARYIPIYSERDIREMNLEYLSDLIRHQGDRSIRGFETQSNNDSKSWVLKQSNNWFRMEPSRKSVF